MKTLILILCAIAILVSIGSIIIGVTGQEAIVFKNISIQEFEFKSKTNCVLFVEMSDGQKLECKLTPEQKSDLMKVFENKIVEMGLKLETK